MGDVNVKLSVLNNGKEVATSHFNYCFTLQYMIQVIMQGASSKKDLMDTMKQGPFNHTISTFYACFNKLVNCDINLLDKNDRLYLNPSVELGGDEIRVEVNFEAQGVYSDEFVSMDSKNIVKVADDLKNAYNDAFNNLVDYLFNHPTALQFIDSNGFMQTHIVKNIHEIPSGIQTGLPVPRCGRFMKQGINTSGIVYYHLTPPTPFPMEFVDFKFNVLCEHDWEKKFLITSHYYKCKKCGEEKDELDG